MHVCMIFFVCVFLVWDFCVVVFIGDFYIGGFYNRNSVQRLIRERSFTKKPADFNYTIFYHLPNNGSVKLLFIGSAVQDQRKSIRSCYNCNIANILQ